MAFTVDQADNKAMACVTELQRCDVLACLLPVNYFTLVNAPNPDCFVEAAAGHNIWRTQFEDGWRDNIRMGKDLDRVFVV